MTRYLYGDLEPFPATHDVLATLRTFVTCAARCLQLVDEADVLEHSLDAAAQDNLRAFEALSVYFAGLVEVIDERAMRSGAPEIVGPYANRLADTVEKMAEQARAARGNALDASALQVTNDIRGKRDEIRRVLAEWLVSDPLPLTSWALSLELAGTAPQGQAILTHPGEITTAFSLDVGRDASWARPRRVGDVASGMAVQVGYKKAFLRSSLNPDLAVLDDFLIAALELGPDSAELHLRRKLDQPRDSFVIAIDPALVEGVDVRITRFEGRTDDSAPYESADDDVTRLSSLADAARKQCQSLLAHKRRLLWVQLDGHDIFEQQLVPALFARVAQRFAPLATEIERRSPNRSELSLKVEGSDGRREEIYLRKSDLSSLLEHLPAKFRAMFHGLALFGEATASGSIAPPPPSPSLPPPSASLPPPRPLAKRSE